MYHKINIFIVLFIVTIVCFWANHAWAGNAYLSWNPSNSPNIAGYYIYYDTLSHATGTCPNDYLNFNNPIDAGNTSNYTVTGLKAGLLYYFQITAYSTSNDESACSYNPGEQSITILTTDEDELESSTTTNDIETTEETETNIEIKTYVPEEVTPLIIRSGGGGGGGSSGNNVTTIAETDEPSSAENILDNFSLIADVQTNNITTEAKSNNTPVQNKQNAIKTISAEINFITESASMFNYTMPVPLSGQNSIIYSKIIAVGTINIDDLEKFRIAGFIQDATPSTKILGAGERGGVINSFISAFSRIPSTVDDWKDVIKIANGRWTNERSQTAENSAIDIFKKIYLRNPNRSTNKYDDNAIMVIAYGLRPSNRNMNNEAAAITIFKNIFKYTPTSATDWDIVRAIAYSGSSR